MVVHGIGIYLTLSYLIDLGYYNHYMRKTCIEMKASIQKITEVHSDTKQIKNITAYLNALFAAVLKEQSKSQHIHSSPLFFDHLSKAQRLEIQVTKSTLNQKAETLLTESLKELHMANTIENEGNDEFSLDLLERRAFHPLLNEIIGGIYIQRSSRRFAMKKYENAIQDARKAILCVEGIAELVEKAEKVRIRSLVALKDEGASDEIAKAKLFVKDIDFIEEMMTKIKMGNEEKSHG